MDTPDANNWTPLTDQSGQQVRVFGMPVVIDPDLRPGAWRIMAKQGEALVCVDATDRQAEGPRRAFRRDTVADGLRELADDLFERWPADRPCARDGAALCREAAEMLSPTEDTTDPDGRD